MIAPSPAPHRLSFAGAQPDTVAVVARAGRRSGGCRWSRVVRRTDPVTLVRSSGRPIKRLARVGCGESLLLRLADVFPRRRS